MTEQGTFARYALVFWKKGYGVTVLPRGKKLPPRPGTTGYYAPGAAPYEARWHEAADGARRDLTEADIRKLAAGEAHHDDLGVVALPGVVVLDVDDGYKDKHGRLKQGACTIAELEERAGVALPAAPSMRAEGRPSSSRRMFFQCPLHVVFRTEAGDDVEVLQPKHRYSAGPGTVHPDGAGVVRCYDAHGEELDPEDFPDADELPMLPDAFVQLLQDDDADDVRVVVRGVDDDTYKAFCTDHGRKQVTVDAEEVAFRLEQLPVRLKQFHTKKPEHGWNRAAYTLTRRVAEEAAAGLLPASEAFAAVQAAYLKQAKGHRAERVLRREAKSQRLRAVAKVLHDADTQAVVVKLQHERAQERAEEEADTQHRNLDYLNALAHGTRAVVGGTTTTTNVHTTTQPEDTSDTGRKLTALPGGGEGGPAPKNVREPIPQLPDDFWTRRPELAHIRQAAACVRCSPDAVLHNVLARLAATSSHQLQLELHEGANPVGLSYFSLNVAPKGYGKTKAAQAAGRLLPGPPDGTPFLDDMPLGSGEGLVEAFMGLQEVDDDDGKKKRKVRTQVRRNALVRIDEGLKFLNLQDRKGSTLGDTVRSIFVGAPIGESNASADTTRVIPAGRYVLGIIMGLQDDLAEGMFSGDNAYNGTPERFAWSSAVDVNMPERRPSWPGELPVTRPEPTQYAAAVHDRDTDDFARILLRMPEGVAAEVDAEEVRKHRNFAERSTDDDDGNHVRLLRMKVAGLLTLLAGRLVVTDDDWNLAGIVTDTSLQVVAYCKRLALQAAQKDAEKREQRAVKLAEKKATATQDKVARQAFVLACGQFARAVHRAHENGEVLTKAQAWRATSGAHRKFTNADDVLQHCLDADQVVQGSDGTLSAGSVEPPWN